MFLPSSIQAVLIFYIPLFYLVIGTATNNLLLTLPPTIPRLPSSTRAVLTTTGAVLTAPITYANTFLFQNLSSTPTSYILDISCRDYDFVSMRVEVLAGGVVEVWRGRRDAATGGLEKLVEQGATGGWEVKVKAKRDYFEDRGGCQLPISAYYIWLMGMGSSSLAAFSPQKPHDSNWGCGARVCFWNALSSR